MKIFTYKIAGNLAINVSLPNLSSYRPIFFLSYLLFFITSCNGQTGKQSQAVQVATIQKNKPDFSSVEGRFDKVYGNVHNGFLDQRGNLWFGTTGAGTLYYDGKHFTHFTLKDKLGNNTLTPLLEDQQGNIWFCTADGIYQYNETRFTPVPFNFSNDNEVKTSLYPAAKPKAVSVISALQDKKGNIWLGTESSGVYYFDGKRFTNILEQEGINNSAALKLNTVTNILEDKKGNIWFASWNREGLCCYDGKSIVNYTPQNGLGDDMIYSLYEDGNSNIWIGTRDHGVWCYDGESFRDITASTNLKSETIYAIKQDHAGTIWFATQSQGVWRYDGKLFENFTIRDGLSHNSVFCIVAAKNGDLWLGTRGMGLSLFDGEKITTLTPN